MHEILDLGVEVVSADPYTYREKAMDQVKAAKSDEAFVVAGTDAIIEPQAVVVKAFNTLVTHAAVLGCGINIFVANVTLEDKYFTITCFRRLCVLTFD